MGVVLVYLSEMFWARAVRWVPYSPIASNIKDNETLSGTRQQKKFISSLSYLLIWVALKLYISVNFYA